MTTGQLLNAWAAWIDFHQKSDPEYMHRQITWIDFGVFIRWIQKAEEAQLDEFEKDPTGAILKMFGKT